MEKSADEMPAPIDEAQARAIAAKDLRDELGNLADGYADVLDSCVVTTPNCWVFFRNPTVSVPPDRYFSAHGALVVSRWGELRITANFSPDERQVRDYALAMSAYFERERRREIAMSVGSSPADPPYEPVVKVHRDGKSATCPNKQSLYVSTITVGDGPKVVWYDRGGTFVAIADAGSGVDTADDAAAAIGAALARCGIEVGNAPPEVDRIPHCRYCGAALVAVSMPPTEALWQIEQMLVDLTLDRVSQWVPQSAR